MDTLALTDRDGTYGAVKFARACHGRRDPAGARGRPGLPSGPRRVRAAVAPARPRDRRCAGGAFRDLHPDRGRARPGSPAARARRWPWPAGGPAGRRCAGWSRRPTWPASAAARCATSTCSPSTSRRHGGDVRGAARAGLRGRPGGDPAPRRPRPGGARAAGATLVAPENLLVEVVSHRLPGAAATGVPAPPPTPPGWPGVARTAGLGDGAHQRGPLRRPPRRPDRRRARRRPPAGRRSTVRHVDRGNAEGFLKSGKQMHEVAEEICRLAGLAGDTGARPTGCSPHTRARRRPVRPRPARRPRPGRGALPRVRGRRRRGAAARRRRSPAGDRADAALRARCEAAIGRRYGSAPRQRDLEAARRRARRSSRGLGYASYFLTVGDVTDLIRELGVRVRGPRVGRGQPGQLPARRLRGRPDPRTAC